jgi:hypothetical protein
MHSRYSDHELFRGTIVPYLERNQFRPRVHAIQKTRPTAYCAKVLGRALLALRNDPNRFWMLLSENTDIVSPSTTATATPAASLPTAATVAAPVNVDPVAATASTTVTASNAVAPATSQKHKACP